MMQMQPQRSRPHYFFDGEVTLDELLSDPVMPALWRADGINEGDVRRLMEETRKKLRRPKQNGQKR